VSSREYDSFKIKYIEEKVSKSGDTVLKASIQHQTHAIDQGGSSVCYYGPGVIIAIGYPYIP
jgi:hypothetical protein